MGSSAEKAWGALLKDVQHLVQHARSTEASDADATALAVKMAAMRVHLARLLQQPPYPRATWKKLVVNLKVGWGQCSSPADQQLDLKPAGSPATSRMAIVRVA